MINLRIIFILNDNIVRTELYKMSLHNLFYIFLFNIWLCQG